MNKIEVRCPNCQTNFVVGNGGNAVTELSGGIHYLVPETIRNENGKMDDRMKAFKDAGIDITKLQSLMQTDANIKKIFSDPNDKVLEEIGKGGFIRNPELFRRWICAQTFRLLKDPSGWTHAVRKTYDIVYIFNQTKRELALLCKLQKKCPNDRRFQFFTLWDLEHIFADLTDYAIEYYLGRGAVKADVVKELIYNATSYNQLYGVISSYTFKFRRCERHVPRNWLNCFKGAGAYYTLQNVIRTHGLVLPDCKDMNESLNMVEHWFKEITSYEPYQRRWDIMLSILTNAVAKTKFELKY